MKKRLASISQVFPLKFAIKAVIFLFFFSYLIKIWDTYRNSRKVNNNYLERLKGPLRHDDPQLIRLMKETGVLVPPSSFEYNLNNATADPSQGQAQLVKKLFESSNKTGGFFVECGAWDGETRSNTLSLERDLHWEGLLIEADENNFELLKSKGRKAWSSQSCLALYPYAHEVDFFKNFSRGRILPESSSSSARDVYIRNYHLRQQSSPDQLARVQCYPLYSFLLALNRTVVDYLSLDVEGSEEEILQTIPFELLRIKVLSIELTHGVYGKGTAQFLKDFMKSKGYTLLTRVISDYSMANDLIFARDDFKVEIKLPDEIFYVNGTLMDIFGKRYVP